MNEQSTTVAGAAFAPNGKTKITAKGPALKLAHKRLTVLQLAESVGGCPIVGALHRIVKSPG